MIEKRNNKATENLSNAEQVAQGKGRSGNVDVLHTNKSSWHLVFCICWSYTHFHLNIKKLQSVQIGILFVLKN